MTAFDQIRFLRFKKILTLHSVDVSSSPNSALLFAIVFRGEANPGDLCGSLCGNVVL